MKRFKSVLVSSIILMAYFGVVACGGKAKLPEKETPAGLPQKQSEQSAQVAGETPAVAPVAEVAPAGEMITPVQLEPATKTLESLTQGSAQDKIHLQLVTKTHEAPMGVEPEKALGWLKNGNTRFAKMRLRADGQSKKDRARLTHGQKPHSILLSCSDSRVPPEIVFDQKLGEIFTVRTAGESLDPTSIASIEYAVEHLGSRLIVVMGHTSCGAVTAALDTLGGKDAGSPNLNHLVADIHPRVQSFMGQKRSEDLELESWANTKGVSKDLLSRSQILRERVASGDLKIVSSLYYLDSGKVIFE